MPIPIHPHEKKRSTGDSSTTKTCHQCSNTFHRTSGRWINQSPKAWQGAKFCSVQCSGQHNGRRSWATAPANPQPTCPGCTPSINTPMCNQCVKRQWHSLVGATT